MRKYYTRETNSLSFLFRVISHSLSNQAWRELGTAYLNAMLDEIILSQRFGEHIGDLIMGGNGVILIIPRRKYSWK